VDTGLTVIDNQTGLEWQKTDDGNGVTDKDNTYTWSDGVANDYSFTGTVGSLITSLNTPPCYAEFCDWRLPLSGPGYPAELDSIVDCSFGNPCIDESLFGPTNASSIYWSFGTVITFGSNMEYVFAWAVNFGTGGLAGPFKTESHHARAVRGLP
jgi:hypothetical protein